MNLYHQGRFIQQFDDSASSYVWEDALKAAIDANTNTHLGHKDWRLPNAKELLSILEKCGSSPAINQDIFPDTPVAWFHSASSYPPAVSGNLRVEFGDGNMSSGGRSHHVRLVRAGQPFDSFDRLDVTFSTTSLSAIPLSPSIAGQLVTLTAAVTGDSPTGTVQFKDNDGNLTCAGGDQALASGVATCDLDQLAVGSYSFTADYAGDTNNTSSTGGPLAYTVNTAGHQLSVAITGSGKVQSEPSGIDCTTNCSAISMIPAPLT